MRLAPVAAALLIVAVALPGCPPGQQLRDDQAAASDVLGDFSLTSLDGQRIRLSEFRGKVLWLAFWATWCEPCRLELPLLQKLWQEFRPRGFELVSVCVDPADRQSLVRQQVRRDGYRFPVLLDRETELIDRFNPTMDLPFGLLVDRRGKIVHIQHGFRLGDEASIRRHIEAALGS